jgi:hypothetical protein
LSRRAFVGLVAAGAAVRFPFFSAAVAARPPGATDDGARRLALCLSDLRGATALAVRLRRACGGSAAVERQFAVERARLHRLASGRTTIAGLRLALRELVGDDFASGRVFLLDGWLLSRTELALCHVVAGPWHTGDGAP